MRDKELELEIRSFICRRLFLPPDLSLSFLGSAFSLLLPSLQKPSVGAYTHSFSLQPLLRNANDTRFAAAHRVMGPFRS